MTFQNITTTTNRYCQGTTYNLPVQELVLEFDVLQKHQPAVPAHCEKIKSSDIIQGINKVIWSWFCYTLEDNNGGNLVKVDHLSLKAILTQSMTYYLWVTYWQQDAHNSYT